MKIKIDHSGYLFLFYTSFFAENITLSLIVLQNCMLTIEVCIDQNMMKLNPSKTEIMEI